MKQKTIKYTRIIFMITAILLISVSNVYSLGIAPSKKIIEYDDQEHIIPIRIINNEARNIKVVISSQGPLSQYVTIDEPVLIISSNEAEKEFKYKLQLPSGMDTGTQTINIVASETNDASGNNTVSGLLTLTHQLQINIPYAKKQLEGYISLSTTKIKDPITTRLILKNNGVEDIESINGTLKIIDANNNIIYTNDIEEQTNMLIGTSIIIDKTLYLENIGIYTVEYDLKYDDKNIIIKKEFNFGEYNIALLETKVNNFKLGTIAKFDVKIATEWNTAINNVYTQLTIRDKNGTLIGQTTSTQNILLPGNNSLIMYWDTANITKGEYLLNLKVSSDEKIITHEYNTIIKDNGIEINSTIEKQNIIKKTISNKLKINVIVIILGLCSIIIILLSAKKHKNKKIYK